MEAFGSEKDDAGILGKDQDHVLPEEKEKYPHKGHEDDGGNHAVFHVAVREVLLFCADGGCAR